MYKLTPRMEQCFWTDLQSYHNLFDGGRCSGWELEELIVKAIRSDTGAQHQPFWQEGGHDDMADIHVRTNGDVHPVQIKSGRINERKNSLTISGHRLGRFKGDFKKITKYLNHAGANIIAVPHLKMEDDNGRHHDYRICYIDIEVLHGLKSNLWKEVGAQHQQTNSHGVLFSLRPSMSWQIWWTVPLQHVKGKGEWKRIR